MAKLRWSASGTETPHVGGPTYPYSASGTVDADTREQAEEEVHRYLSRLGYTAPEPCVTHAK